jgi:hypothetical protein
MNTKQATTNRASLGRVLFQVNTKGEKVAKIGGCESAEEGALYALRLIVKAKGMTAKDGAKYLRTLGVSRTQTIYFDSFGNTRALALGKIRLGEFVDKYEIGTLCAIIAELEK